jgi:hypothetical protein
LASFWRSSASPTSAPVPDILGRTWNSLGAQ